MQPGILTPPGKYSLIQIYSFEELPLIAMNVARIGAQTPGMASEIAGKEEHCAVVGFGPMNWILITPEKPVPGGFRAFDETNIGDEEAPETKGDLLFYFSSDHAELNREIATKILDLFGNDSEIIDEVVVENFITGEIEPLAENLLIDGSTNLDSEQSSFVFTQRFKGTERVNSDHYQKSFVCDRGTGQELFTMTFGNDPARLEDFSESVPRSALSRGLFFLPSLDLLTSLRMGGIRMGSLAINAKWKGH